MRVEEINYIWTLSDPLGDHPQVEKQRLKDIKNVGLYQGRRLHVQELVLKLFFVRLITFSYLLRFNTKVSY